MAFTTTASGLQYEDTVVGEGAEAVKGQQVSVHYTGWLYNNGEQGAKFDSSRDRNDVFAFGLGVAVYYMASHSPLVQDWLPRWLLADGLWFAIQPISAGVFGVPAGLLAAALVSRITRPAPPQPPVRLEM